MKLIAPPPPRPTVRPGRLYNGVVLCCCSGSTTALRARGKLRQRAAAVRVAREGGGVSARSRLQRVPKVLPRQEIRPGL